MAFEYYVYRFLNKANEVIYVGRTNDLETRFKSHFGKNLPHARKRNREVDKIQYTLMEYKVYAVLYEIQLINIWKPIYNDKHKYGETTKELFSVDHLIWSDFDSDRLIELKGREVARREKKVKIKNFTVEELSFLNQLEQRGLFLTESESKILVSIKRSENECISSVDIISQCMISRKTLYRSAKRLIENSVITMENTSFKNGINGTNIYKLLV